MQHERQPLGEILIERGLLTSEQLVKALNNQLLFGGRLGTNLVELSMVGIDDIGPALAHQHSVELATPELLMAVDPAALAVLDAAAVTTYEAIPLREEGQLLHVVMIFPSPQRVAKLGQQIGRTVRPYVAPELRLRYFLERHYGIERKGRFLRMPDGGEGHAQRRRYLEATVALPDKAKPQVAQMAEGLATQRLESETNNVIVAPLSDTGRRELQDTARPLTTVTSTPTEGTDQQTKPIYVRHETSPTQQESPAVGTDTEPHRPSRIEEVVHKLAQAETGGVIAKVLCLPLAPEASITALFWVRGKMAVGCHAHGVPMTLEQMQQLAIALDQPSLLQWAFRAQGVICARGQHDVMQHQIARHLGTQEPSHVAVAPVLLDERVVNLIVVHAHEGRLPERMVNDLRLLTRAATRAYEGLRRRIKETQAPPAAN